MHIFITVRNFIELGQSLNFNRASLQTHVKLKRTLCAPKSNDFRFGAVKTPAKFAPSKFARAYITAAEAPSHDPRDPCRKKGISGARSPGPDQHPTLRRRMRCYIKFWFRQPTQPSIGFRAYFRKVPALVDPWSWATGPVTILGVTSRALPNSREEFM